MDAETAPVGVGTGTGAGGGGGRFTGGGGGGGSAATDMRVESWYQKGKAVMQQGGVISS
jgi:hypothetical protein